MRAIRRADTNPERALRSALHAQGLRFRVDFPVPTEGRSPRPDIAFTRSVSRSSSTAAFGTVASCTVVAPGRTPPTGGRRSLATSNAMPTRTPGLRRRAGR